MLDSIDVLFRFHLGFGYCWIGGTDALTEGEWYIGSTEALQEFRYELNNHNKVNLMWHNVLFGYMKL